jgi:Bacterial Ig-like domain (group 3)
MGSRIIRLVALAAVSVVMLNGAVASASSVSVPLSQTSFGDMVVDDANQHVFISSPADNSVAVFDFSGDLVTTLSNLPGASGMVIVGSTLYVSEGTSGTIERFNLATLADQGSLATGLTDPRWLAYAGGKIWATETEQGDQADQLASISLTGTTKVFATAYYGADLATSPATPNDLYLSEDGSSPGTIIEFGVSGSSPAVLVRNSWTPQANIEELAISPDGARVIPAAGAPGDFVELSASALAADGVNYPGGATYPSAVAVSPGDGGLLAAGLFGYGTPDIEVFPIGATAPIFTAGITGSNGWGEFVPHGVALSGSGAKLFGVSSDAPSDTFEFWTFDLDPKATGTSVSISPDPSNSGQQTTFTATVAPTDAGGTVSFTADGQPVAGCSTVPLTSAPVGATATCTIPSLPAGTDTVSAAYSGDSAYDGSTGTASATVALPAGSDYTWSGPLLSSYFWSAAGNWSQNIAPYGIAGTLTFPNTSSCSAGTSCVASNDVTGLTANAIVVDSDGAYQLYGNDLTLGAGGLTIESPSGNARPPLIDFPITLGAGQVWTINEGPTSIDSVTGNKALTVNFNSGSIEPNYDIEVGSVSASGAGGFYLDGGASVNGTDDSPIVLAGGAGIEADQPGNTVGPVTVGPGGWLSVGGVDDGAGELSVSGSATFASGSELDLYVDQAGTSSWDYSQLSTTGNVDISGAQLDVSQGVDGTGGCTDLNPGDVLTLVATTGTLTGTFTNYANGATVDIANDCNTANQDATGTLSYSANAVNLTITSGGNAGSGGGGGGANPAPVELVAPSVPTTAQVGQILQINPGSWQHATSYDYSWLACNGSACTPIPNVSSSTFQVTAAQLGDQIEAMVTALGAGGTRYAYTNRTATVTAAVTAQSIPIESSAPKVSGTAAVGDVLTTTNGTWSNSPSSFAYQWEHCSLIATGCVPISGATSQTFTLTSAELGTTVEVQVTAINYAGRSLPARSVPSGVVRAATAPHITPAAIITALRGVLTPTGKAASLSAVRTHHGYTFIFHAPSAGKLVVIWTTILKHKTVTVAKSTATASGPRTLKILVRLTAAGANALKRSTHLKIKSNSAFTANGMKPIHQSGSFTLTQRKSSHQLRARGRTLALMRKLGI